MHKVTFSMGAVAIFLIAAIAPLGQSVGTSLSLGFAYEEDFESGDGGWTASPVNPPQRPAAVSSWAWGALTNNRPAPANPSWQWGAPTSGPGVAASGANVWATNLAGNYNINECAAIMSPPITIPSGATASFSFLEWRHFEWSGGTATMYDTGRLFVTSDAGVTLNAINSPTPPYQTAIMHANAALCHNGIATTAGAYGGAAGTTPPAPTYTPVSANLSSFAGTTIRVVISFGSDPSVTRAGWYIDDFTVTVNGVSAVEDFESSDGGFTIVSASPPVTHGPGAAKSGSKLWATNLNGLYGASECGAILSPPISIPTGATASVSFWQWRHMHRTSSTGTISDAGRLFVTPDGGATLNRIDAPVPAYDVGTLGSTAATCLNAVPTTGTNAYTGPFGAALPAPTYSQITADLSLYAGSTVQVAIAFASDSSTHYSGWYIDDFGVTINGATTVEDFEASNGGFTIVGTKVAPPPAHGWEYGVPPLGIGPGPISAMWATNLEAAYGPNECAYVDSPPIKVGEIPLPSVVVANLSWDQWYRGSTTGAGIVLVGNDTGFRKIAPYGGYPGSSASSTLDACLGHTSADRSAFTSSTLPVGMTTYKANVSAWAGQEVVLRFLFASSSSTPSSTSHGWYFDNVAIETSVTVDVAPPSIGTGPNAPLWTSGGPRNTWAYGVATAEPVGETTYKTNLAGNHDANECSYIESPAIPGALLDMSPLLRFEHWYRIPGAAVNVPWAAGVVLVSGDNGLTWQHVAMSDYTRPVRDPPTYVEVHDDCLVNFGSDAAGGAYGGDKRTWTWSDVDLSAYATSTTVKVRFAYGSDGTFAYQGWAIRAVEFGGLKLL